MRQRSKVSACRRFVLCASWLGAPFTLGTARVGSASSQQLPRPLTASISQRGNCWDSTCCSETLFGSLNVERLHDQCFITRPHAKDETLAWLLWYNRSWLHSTLNYVSLMQFEQHWLAGQAKRASSQPRLLDTQFEGKIRPGLSGIATRAGLSGGSSLDQAQPHESRGGPVCVALESQLGQFGSSQPNARFDFCQGDDAVLRAAHGGASRRSRQRAKPIHQSKTTPAS